MLVKQISYINGDPKIDMQSGINYELIWEQNWNNAKILM